MAAILRTSGKFLRIVSGFSKSGSANPAGGQQGQKDGNGSFISIPNLDSSNNGGQSMPFHAWSMQNLQSALPILSSDPDKKFEEKDFELDQRRGSDPLLEFYVDKQKLADVSKQIKSSASFEGRIGLNVAKDLKDEVKEIEIKPIPIKAVEEKEVQTSPTINVKSVTENEEEKKPELVNNNTVPEPIQNVATVVVDPDLETEVVSTYSSPVDFAQFEDIQPQQPPQAFCEDPISHQWYPLPVVCQMFRLQGRIYDLECLLMGSQGIRPEDRKCIYFWTLQAYADVGMFPQAVDLTRRLETEGLAVDFPEYHSLMDGFAMAMYQQQRIPTAPASIEDVASQASTNYPNEQSLPPTPASGAEEQLAIQALHHRKLKKALASKNTKACIEHFKGLERVGGKDLNITESSSLIELLVKEDLIEDAVDVAEKMLSREAYPMPRIFRFLLNRLASKGEVEAMTRLGVYLTSRIRKEVSFDNRLCNAYLAAGRAKDCLDIMIKDLDELIIEKSATNTIDDEKLQVLKEKFPRGGAMGLLEANPHLVEPYTNLALKFVELGYVAPVNVLWTYHFINGRHDLAEPLWNNYVRTCPQIMFQKVCQTARSTSNVDLAERLVVLLENAVVTNGARGIAYSCLLDVLTQNEDYTKGINSLEIGLNSGIKLDDMNRTALKRLKDGLEAQGDDFPYEIPKKTSTAAHSIADHEESPMRSLSPALMMA